MNFRDDRVDDATRARWSRYSDEQIVKDFYDRIMDPWNDWHDPETWAMLERVTNIAEDRRSI